MIPKVFIPQVTLRLDRVINRLVPAHDFTPAMQHGELTPVLGDDDDPTFLSHLAPKVKKALIDFTHEDFLLAAGDPALIALCAGVIARKLPAFKMLKWSKELKMYTQLEIRL